MNIDKFIIATSKTFASSSGKTPEYKSWHRLFVRTMTDVLESFNCKDIKISKSNHFDGSGFFTHNNQYWYFSISDLRYFKTSMLVRKVSSYQDFHGERNQYVTLKNGYSFFIELRNIIVDTLK